ncbi:MAG TPA: carboxypeptidase regulatory-like domain-containing protein [Pyrinomonadaceae bacterium]|jgi:Tfp pilus assembly protein PilF|nr:carboxypeptidase regulatory-like domain-containing protein [Pyrinomonadaceae bacterium]
MINRTRAFVILALLPLFLVAPGARAQQPQQPGKSIRGRAHSSSGDGVAWVVVRLLSAKGESVTLTVTNNAGEFMFSGLQETSYMVVVAAPGYQTAIEKVNLNAGAASPGGVHTVDLKLLPGGGVSAQPSPPAFTQNVPKAARDVFERAMRLGRAGRKEVANTLMSEAIKIFPDYFDAHFALSSEMVKAGRLTEAVAELEQASRINPKDDRVYQSFGVIMMRLKRFEIAAAIFSEAARLNPAEPLHPVMRANALIDYAFTIDASSSRLAATERSEALDEAERNLRLAASKNGKHLSEVHLQMARLYQERGERMRAADELDQYLSAEPGVPNAEEIRAIIKRLRTPASQAAPPSPPQ